MLPLELLNVKANPEQELETWVLNSKDCNREVRGVSGVGIKSGHLGHREPAVPAPCVDPIERFRW